VTHPAQALALSDLATAGAWEQLHLEEEANLGYRRLTGWDGPEMPAGLGIVAARRAFTRGRRLPPGGVLLGIELDSRSAPPEDGEYEFQVDAGVRKDSAGHTLVRVCTRLRRPGGGDIADVTFLLRWPDV
jgi:hypothetical protein